MLRRHAIRTREAPMGSGGLVWRCAEVAAYEKDREADEDGTLDKQDDERTSRTRRHARCGQNTYGPAEGRYCPQCDVPGRLVCELSHSAPPSPTMQLARVYVTAAYRANVFVARPVGLSLGWKQMPSSLHGLAAVAPMYVVMDGLVPGIVGWQGPSRCRSIEGSDELVSTMPEVCFIQPECHAST